MKRQSKSVLGIERTVRLLALADAHRRGFDGIILGHTYYAHDEIDPAGIRYLNSGSWVDDACSYIKLAHDRLRLCLWIGEQAVAQPGVQWSSADQEAGVLAIC